MKEKRSQLKFGMPMIWQEPKSHYNNYFFHLVIWLVSHSEDVPVPSSLDLSDLSDTTISSFEVAASDENYDFEATSSEHLLFTRGASCILNIDLYLLEERSELSAFRLKEKTLLSASTKVIFFGIPGRILLPFFSLSTKMGLSNY